MHGFDSPRNLWVWSSCWIRSLQAPLDENIVFSLTCIANEHNSLPGPSFTVKHDIGDRASCCAHKGVAKVSVRGPSARLYCR